MRDTALIKGYKGMGMEGPVARWYAAITRKSMEDFKTLAARVAAETQPGARVLEVAPGPGYFSIELARRDGYHVTAVDISRSFVEIARANAREAGVDVDFRLGNASALPFESATFDYVLCRAAFKNFTEPVRALQEMCRVLRPGGRALVFDLRKDASPGDIARAVDAMGLSFPNGMITKLTFRFMLLKRAYTRKEIERFLAEVECESKEVREDLIGLEIHLRK